jgi:hypothetical protein
LFSNRNNSQWIWIAAFLFFGYGIFSAIAFAVVVFMGLPYEWSFGLSTAMVLGGVYLLYQRYSWMAWVLAACLGFILLTGLSLLRAIATPEPAIPADLRPYIEERHVSLFDALDYDVLDYEEGFEYLSANPADSVISPSEQRTLLFSYDQFGMPQNRLPLTVEFPALESPDSQWAFYAGEVRASGGLQGVFRAVPADNYPSPDQVSFRITESTLAQAFTPYVVIEIPLSRAQVEREIEIEAQLEVVIPDAVGQAQPQTLTRRFNLMLASDNFWLYQTDYDNWIRARQVIETPLWLVLLVGSIGCGAASVALVQRGALQKSGPGDFIMVVRRRGGLEHLGAEAHPLSKVDPSATSGVVLGFVNAQSPAGRAGLRAGEQITQVDGKPVQAPKELDNALKKYKRGQHAQVSLLRNGVPLDLTVKF